MSRRDRKFSISATACDSDPKESQGVANKFLAGFDMIAESLDHFYCNSLRFLATLAIIWKPGFNDLALSIPFIDELSILYLPNKKLVHCT